MTGRAGDTLTTEDVFAALHAGTAWGQIARGGRFHAFRQAWWDDTKWVPACNRHASYTDLQLASLDSAPGSGVCGQQACMTSYNGWRRYSRG